MVSLRLRPSCHSPCNIFCVFIVPFFPSLLYLFGVLLAPSCAFIVSSLYLLPSSFHLLVSFSVLLVPLIVLLAPSCTFLPFLYLLPSSLHLLVPLCPHCTSYRPPCIFLYLFVSSLYPTPLPSHFDVLICLLSGWETLGQDGRVVGTCGVSR